MGKQVKRIDISKFRRDHSFYGKLNLCTTVKSFDLSSIRNRYLESQKENDSGIVGSVERRKPGLGGIVQFVLWNGTARFEVLKKMREPRGISQHGEKFAVASENRIFLITKEELKEIDNPWFSYIHSLDFSSSGNHLLLDSSGFDCIFELDINNSMFTYQWFAWENGFNEGQDPKTGQKIILTKDETEARNLESEGINHKYISDPENQYLPTALRSFFLNKVKYDERNEDYIIVTSFHKSSIFSLNKKTNRLKPIIGNLKNPHGGMNFNGSYLATSTRSGEVVLSDNDQEVRLDFRNLKGKPSFLGDMEWVQNTIPIDNLLVAIDSNRNSFVILDIKNKLYDQVEYNSNWAIQDLIEDELEDYHIEKLINLEL